MGTFLLFFPDADQVFGQSANSAATHKKAVVHYMNTVICHLKLREGGADKTQVVRGDDKNYQ